MKVAISFVDTADVAAKPQDRLRFSFGGAVAQKRNAARRCEVVIRDVYYDTAFERFMASQSVQRFKNGVRKLLEIATNKNSLALSA